jgi:hypothetical protein
MAFIAVYPNGLGESLADSVAVNAPFYTTGNVWYVHDETGTDAATPAGQNRTKPLATLGQAYTNASDGDVIVLMDGHTETLGAGLTIAKRLLIVGGGESDGKPTVKLALDDASDSMLTLSAAGTELRNVWIEENEQTNSAPRVLVTGNRCRFRGMYFQCGATDTGAALRFSTVTTGEVEACTFVSTATSLTAQPQSAVSFLGTNVDIRFRDCVFDGGTMGFSAYWAVYSQTVSVEAVVFENCTLLRGADIIMNDDTAGWVGGITATESALINFAGEGGV